MKQQRQRTEIGVQQLAAQYAAQKSSMTQLLNKQKAMLDSLTAQQQAAGGRDYGRRQHHLGRRDDHRRSRTPGRPATQADKAVAFAYAQLGKPYEWGATGPSSYRLLGPHVRRVGGGGPYHAAGPPKRSGPTLPHIPMSDLQPGDLILYNGESHVAMYVGNGYIIDAPHTGAVVERSRSPPRGTRTAPTARSARKHASTSVTARGAPRFWRRPPVGHGGAKPSHAGRVVPREHTGG